MAYNGSVKLISGLTQKSGNFPLIHAKDVYVSDTYSQEQINQETASRILELKEMAENWDASASLGALGEIAGEYVTPEEYGAVGDGVNNDATALQAALESGKRVIMTQDLYCKSRVFVQDRSWSLDGRGYTIHFDYTGIERGWSNATTFGARVNPLPAGETSDFYIRTGGAYIAVWDEWKVDFVHPFDPLDPTKDTMKFGYISYRGDIPAEQWMIDRLDNDPDATIKYYPKYSFSLVNTNFRFCNCQGIFGPSFERFVDSEIRNISVVCENDNNGDGKCGVRVEGCSGVIIDNIYVEGWCDRYTWDYMGEYGYGMAIPSDNVFITRYVGKNNRDHFAGGGSNFSHWSSRTTLDNAYFTDDGGFMPNRPGWWNNRTNYSYWDGFETHGNAFSILFTNIVLVKYNLEEEHEFSTMMEFRCPYIRVQNVEIYGKGIINFPPEYVDYIHCDNVWAPGCDVRAWFGGDSYKTAKEREVLFTNSLFRRTDDSYGFFVMHFVNCWIVERVWTVSYLKMEGCTVWADLDWGIMTSIEAREGVWLTNCDIYSNASFYTPATTAIVTCPENKAMISNCRFYLLPNNTVFSSPQRYLKNVMCESRFGCKLRSNLGVLGFCYPYPENEDGMYNLWEGHPWEGNE